MKAVRLSILLLWHAIISAGLGVLALQIAGNLAFDPIAYPRAVLAAWEKRASSPAEELDIGAAEEMARRTLKESPLETQAIKLLGLAAERRGDPVEAKRLMSLAETRTKGDIAAHVWLFKADIAAVNLPSALEHLDAILRIAPVLLREMFKSIEGIALYPGGAQQLAEKLSANPPWRSAVIKELGARAANPAAPMAVFYALLPTSAPPTADELNPYLDRLVREKLFQRAYLLWTRSLPPERYAELKNLFNGNFERVPTGAPFDWRLEPVRGVRSGLVNGPTGRALSVQFLNARVPFRHVRQLLLLIPGSYELKGRLKSEGLQTGGKLRWTISCADTPHLSLAASEPIQTSSGWDDMTFQFEISGRDCRAQWLTLELAARVASEQQIAGQVWFDQFNVARITSSTQRISSEQMPRQMDQPAPNRQRGR